MYKNNQLYTGHNSKDKAVVDAPRPLILAINFTCSFNNIKQNSFAD